MLLSYSSKPYAGGKKLHFLNSISMLVVQTSALELNLYVGGTNCCCSSRSPRWWYKTTVAFQVNPYVVTKHNKCIWLT